MGRHRQPLDPARRALSERMRGVARSQGGVITAAQCAGLGATASDIRRLLASGEWRRVRRGIYADAGEPADPHLRRCAAVLAGLRANAGVVSHLSAARILGLPLPPAVDGRVSLTRRPPAPTSGPRSSHGVGVAVHLTGYDDSDVVEIDGVPVLGGARLVLDCCAVVPPDSALAIADAAVAKGVATLDALVDAAARRRGRRLCGELARLVVARTDPLSDNWFESSSRWWLLEAGLPRPELQVRFAGPQGGFLRVDMLMRDTWTVGEADGAGKYDEPGVLFAEKRREDWFARPAPAGGRPVGARRDAHPARRAGVADRFWRVFARGRRAG